MKKVLSLILTLCLICLSCAALGEAQAPVTDGSPLVLDNFTLNLDAGAAYVMGTKAPQEVYLTVYPYYANGDGRTNFNVVWAGGASLITTSMIKEQLPQMEEQIKAGFEPYGITMNALKYEEPADHILDGMLCVKLDSFMTLSGNGATMDVYQRQYYVGAKGYIFTVSGSSKAELDATAALFETVLKWN